MTVTPGGLLRAALKVGGRFLNMFGYAIVQGIPFGILIGWVGWHVLS